MSTSPKLADKAEEIRRILSEPTVDLWRLRELASTEGGLVNDSLRKLAWPKLVGVHNGGYGDATDDHRPCTSPRHACDDDAPPSAVPRSLDHEQIERDVSRVTWHLLTGNQRSRNFQMKNKHRKRIAQLLKKKQRRLGDYLNLVLVMSYHDGVGGGPSCEEGDGDGSYYVGDDTKGGMNGADDEDRLRYYQGFHDVASIVLSALGGASLPASPLPTLSSDLTADDTDDVIHTDAVASSMGLTLACQVLQRLARSHLRDAMRANFHQLQSALKLIVLPLAAAFDPQIHSHLVDCEMEPYFCLSWVITWFGHDVRDTALVKRLYDFFIVSHPLMAVYMSVAMMIHPLNRIEILGTDCDFACVHNALADLPKNSSNVGWKYLPGDAATAGGSGYVTGEDDDVSYDPSLQDQSLDGGDEGSLGGHHHGGGRPRVPFQELIDLSISLMHKIPPRNLVNLAQRYHTEITLQPLMAQTSSIALLQPPPSWGLAPRADSDWVLRQRMREEYGSTKLNRHQRKNRLKQQGSFGDAASVHPLLDEPPVRSLIASGTGPDGRAEARKLRKKRRMMARGVAVVILSVLVALARNYLARRPLASSQQLTKDALAQDNVARMLLEDDSANLERDDGPAKADVEDNATDALQEAQGDETDSSQALGRNADHVVIAKETPSEVDACASDEAANDGIVTDEAHVSMEARSEQHPSPTSKNAALQVLARSSVLFVKNLTDIQNNRTLDTRLDKLERHIDFLMMQLIKTAKAGWLHVAPVVANALRIGWRQIKMGWLKLAPAAKREMGAEANGGSLEWAGDARKTWKKQEALLRNQGKLIKSVVLDARKHSKAREERIGNRR